VITPDRHIRGLLLVNERQCLQIERLDRGWRECQREVARLRRQLDEVTP
jgi:hypothetical protein